ncbi:unnamed protein product [Adineta steineri]|uniref:G-protein coupled receptors family 1 profile domain-containing protein n=1 Tax=Adineta steineri TaxID=433720 RepID=A0A816DXU9_9BILA|nr:unnamed protein product [Adineta steineri]CAF1638773.1 unnamed protein product [Adineta steineri]
MPLYINYFRLGFVWPQKPIICFIWWYINYAIYGTIVIFLAWTSFERHLLVFHHQLFTTQQKQWLFHYFPMIFFTLYPIIFYLLVLLIPSCNDKYLFDYTEDICHYYPCYYYTKILNLYDILINGIVPCLLIGLFSIILLLRIIWEKRVRLGRPIQWRKYRKMTIQLLLISLIFVLFNFPLLIYYLMIICGNFSLNINPQIVRYFLFLESFTVLFLPFVILFSLPKQYWRKKWRKKIINLRRRYRNQSFTHISI